jgi:hypothetical protein
MSKYQVEVHHIEHRYDYYEIEAESPEKARDLVNEGNGEYMFSEDDPDWRDPVEEYVTSVYNEEGDPIL